MGAFAGVGNIEPGIIVDVLSVLIGIGELTLASSTWLMFVRIVTLVYALLTVDSYHLQLLNKGNDEDEANQIIGGFGQDIFPSVGCGSRSSKLLWFGRQSSTLRPTSSPL